MLKLKFLKVDNQVTSMLTNDLDIKTSWHCLKICLRMAKTAFPRTWNLKFSRGGCHRTQSSKTWIRARLGRQRSKNDQSYTSDKRYVGRKWFHNSHEAILGFHMTSQALLKSVSAVLVSLGVNFMLLIGHFYSEASLLSLSYFANYMNIQKEKNDKSTRH